MVTHLSLRFFVRYFLFKFAGRCTWNKVTTAVWSTRAAKTILEEACNASPASVWNYQASVIDSTCPGSEWRWRGGTGIKIFVKLTKFCWIRFLWQVGHWRLRDVDKFLPFGPRLSDPRWWQRWQSEPWDAQQRNMDSTSWLAMDFLLRALSWLLKPKVAIWPFLKVKLFVSRQNLRSTKSHHAKTGIRVTVEMLGNTGTAKDHLQPWCHHPGTKSQIAHFHSRIIQSWQLLRPSIRIRVDTLSRCSCSLFRFFDLTRHPRC